MQQPPIPPEQNPKQHHERPGEPPANWPQDPKDAEDQSLEDLYEQEEQERSAELYEQRTEPLKNPNRT